MVVLGIDPGTSATGYGLIRLERGALRLIDAGVLRSRPGGPLPGRIRALCDDLEVLLRDAKPDGAAMEGLFTARNVRSALTLAQLRGAYLLTLSRSGLEVAEYAPGVVKKAVTGHGAADKIQVRAMVRRLLAVPGEDLALDASDALAIAICHAHSEVTTSRRRLVPR